MNNTVGRHLVIWQTI